MNHVRPLGLSRLAALIGEWRIEASVHGQRVGSGRTTFTWLEGDRFLVQQSEGDPPPPGTPAEWVANSPHPTTTIIGWDDAADRYTVLYADARGVLRVYQMGLADGVWTMWRDAPGFCQRFVGTFSDDGATITGRWETSSDGSRWETDFDLAYTKIS